jgi:hypothetical protein
VSEDPIERSRDLSEVERIDEQARVPDLAVPHEAMELCLQSQPSLLGLLLERLEGRPLARRLDDPFHDGGTQRAHELVLQVCLAHVEAKGFEVSATEVRPEAGALERTLEVVLLGGVAESCKPDTETSRPESVQNLADRLCTPDWENRDTFRIEISIKTPGQRLERQLVADPLDEHDPARRESVISVWVGRAHSDY